MATAAPNAGREVLRRGDREQALNHAVGALAERLNIKAAGKRRQEPDIGQAREAAADARVVRKHRDRQSLAEIAQAVGGFAARLGEAEEQFGDAVTKPSGAHRLDGGDDLNQGLRRIAGLGDHHEARGGEVEAGKRALERPRIEIVVEAGARTAALPAIAVIAGNAPAAELRQRLAAEARSAGAEEHQCPGVLGERGESFAGGRDVVAPLRHAQQRQRAGRIGIAQGGEAWLKAIESAIELGLRQAGRADASLKAAFDRLQQRHGWTLSPAPFSALPRPACRRWW